MRSWRRAAGFALAFVLTLVWSLYVRRAALAARRRARAEREAREPARSRRAAA